MFTLPLSPRAVLRLIAVATLAICCMTATAASAASHTRHGRHGAARAHVAATPALRKASRIRNRADRVLVRKARQLKRCRRVRPGHCTAQRRAVQRAGIKLARTERRLAALGRLTRRVRSAAGIAAPELAVRGDRLTWGVVGRASTYVLVRKVRGLADQYSLVSGTSVTPPAVPGATVHYSVRAAVDGSAWAHEVWISYPAAEPTTTDQTPTPVPTTDPTPTIPAPGPVLDTLAAPDVNVAGQQLTWNPVAGIATYVLVTKVSGRVDRYTAVSGTSVTPPAVPGETVHYSVRTAVDGSAWAPQVAISYPSAPAPAPAPTPDPTPAPPVDGSFSMGLVGGTAATYELGFIKQMGAHTARVAFNIGTPVSQMTAAMDAYAKAGVRPLLLAMFYGRNPTTAEAQSLASWAAAFGPNGSFWAGKSYPANTAVTDIEFGNETSYSYQFSDNSMGTYAARAQTYALRVKDAQTAIQAANPNVGLLAIGDNAVNQSAWVVNMFNAVPDLGSRVAGWTIHPYGPTWQTRIDSTINSTKAAGSPDLPIWITEWGISTDNGRCLSDNYGYDKCMTYSAAATTLHGALTGMKDRYGSRLGAFYLYQAHDQQATGTQTGRESYFGALQSNNAPKGAYTTEVQSDLAAN
jgi:hypothetical protein